MHQTRPTSCVLRPLRIQELLGDDTSLAIRIELDKEKRELSVIDNGIGMSRDELIDNLGTIAKSGTAEFLQQMTGDEQKDATADRAIWRGLLFLGLHRRR